MKVSGDFVTGFHSTDAANVSDRWLWGSGHVKRSLCKEMSSFWIRFWVFGFRGHPYTGAMLSHPRECPSNE